VYDGVSSGMGFGETGDVLCSSSKCPLRRRWGMKAKPGAVYNRFGDLRTLKPLAATRVRLRTLGSHVWSGE
jgi:hypothetical protein